jgi:putative tryptophan/tyrosine transport system substrate-binding protein
MSLAGTYLKHIAVAAAVTCGVVGYASVARPEPRPEGLRGDVNIAIASVADHAAVRELKQGFRAEIDSSDYARRYNVIFSEYRPGGSAAYLHQVANYVARSRPDLVYVLGTPAAEAIQHRTRAVLLVQGAVTDPVQAGLAAAWQGSGRRYVATSDLPPIEKQVDLIRRLTPNVRRLGVLYNSGESNSNAVILRLDNHLRRHHPDIHLIKQPLSSTDDLAVVLDSMIGRVDALYLPPDNTTHLAFGEIGRFAGQHAIPLYASDANALKYGALATLSPDYTRLGRESARLALQVLQGADPETLPISLNENPEIAIDSAVAAKLGVNITGLVGRAGVRIRNHP